MTGRVLSALFVAASLPLWAAGVDEAPGVSNFHQVNDHVYRGAQPTAEGFTSLSRLGVQTVIDLRNGSDHERWEQGMVERAGMRYVHVPLSGIAAPAGEQIAQVLALLDDSARRPVFVHCRRGADRTGTVIACYRIAHDHWANEKALAEAKQHGMSLTERSMQYYILHFRNQGK